MREHPAATVVASHPGTPGRGQEYTGAKDRHRRVDAIRCPPSISRSVVAKGKCSGRESASCAGETALDWGEQVPVTLGREHLDLCRGKGALGLGRSHRESHHGTARQPEQWAEPGSHWPHCPELQRPKPIPAPVPWSLHQGAELTPQHWLHWSMVCSDWSMGTLGTGAGQGTESSSASESWSPIIPAQGLQTETTFLHTFPVSAVPALGCAWAGCAISSWAQDPSWQITLHAADPQLSSTSRPWPCIPSLPAPSSVDTPAQLLACPLPHLGNSPLLNIPFLPTLHPCLPGVLPPTAP